MKIEQIYQFFADEPTTFISQEQAICYILATLLEGETCSTELVQKLESEYSKYRISDTILFNALQFLEKVKAVDSYLKKTKSRGRPRRMFRLNIEWRIEAEKLAQLWRKQTLENKRLAP